MSPLALMIRPHGSSPHHSLALVLALTAIRASKPFSLVHITPSAPSMLIALGGENSLSNSLVRSGRDRPTVVLAAPRHQHEDDARDLCHTTFNLKNLKPVISMTYRSARYLITTCYLITSRTFRHLT
jgi:hypothetical protein